MLTNWEGKSWGTLGDSITAKGGYQPLVQRALRFREVLNYGKGGCTMTAGGERDVGATTNVGGTISPTLDCVTIFAGVNDFRLGIPIGAANSYDRYTFFGAYRCLIEQIWERNPACKLNVWTPLRRDKDGYDIYFVNAAGCKLADYAEVVRIVGLQYSIPVLDLYADSGFDSLTLSHLTVDGLHPNQAGYARIAELAIPFLAGL